MENQWKLLLVIVIVFAVFLYFWTFKICCAPPPDEDSFKNHCERIARATCLELGVLPLDWNISSEIKGKKMSCQAILNIISCPES